jgi:parallel beta-helix repeat protein
MPTGRTGEHKIYSLNVTGGTGGRGIEVRSDHNYFIGNSVSNNAGEGLRIREGNYNQLTHNVFYRNGDHGARVRDGNGNYFFGNTAADNGSEELNSGEGFKFRGDHNIVYKNIAVGNFDNGFGIDSGTGNKLIENFSANNGRPPKLDENNNIVQRFAGFSVAGTGSKISKNTSWNNTEFDALDGNENCADNIWRQNVFGTSALGLPELNDDGDTINVNVVESPDCIR